MRPIKRLLLLGLVFFLSACGEWSLTPLPFPTPAQHDLVVLTRPGLLTYTSDDSGNVGGLEHDLVEAFAQELGVAVKYVVATPNEFAARLGSDRFHIAAAWLSPEEGEQNPASPAIFLSRDVLTQNDASLPLTELAQLAGKTVHVMAGSRQAATLNRLAQTIQKLKVVEVSDGDILDLLEALNNGKVDYVAMDGNLEDIATQYFPSLDTTLVLSDEKPIIWHFGKHPNTELVARVREFIERVKLDGTLARLEDRYFGHVRRLEQEDVVKFLGEIETTLPRLREHFQAAETVSGIDWRLLAAIAYHESHWDPNATSRTGVRGIMMLTEETADRMGVSNRLNARESILAGARYLALLKEQHIAGVAEPDRTWLALAAYNIGPGHFGAARRLATQLSADDSAWFEMKRVLPLLAQPKYYQRIKSSRARGGEAVILVENIRSYYDILLRHERPYQPLNTTRGGMTGKLGTGTGLKLKQQ